MEIFKDIKGYEGIYQISNLGNVKSIKYGKIRILKKSEDKRGKNKLGFYARVNLSKNNIQNRLMIHRIVALTFIPNPDNKPQVNHIDWNASNNGVNNLEWCTASENEIHSYKKLNKINPIRKLSKTDVIDIRNNCVKGKGRCNYGNVIDFMNKYKVDRTTILNVLNNKYYV